MFGKEKVREKRGKRGEKKRRKKELKKKVVCPFLEVRNLKIMLVSLHLNGDCM